MSSKDSGRAIALVVILAGLAIVTRLAPHAPNMALLGTLAFVAGRYWPRGSRWLPLVAAVVTDAVLGFYDWRVMVAVWLSYAVTAQLGRLTAGVELRPLNWRPTLSIISLTLLGSALFFVITNSAVWAAGWYPPTLAGWMQCLINGLPFARNTVVSDLSYTVTAIAMIEGILAIWPQRAVNPHLASIKSR